ncbi:MAG: aspartate kinase [Bacillota bacterium]
MKTVRVKVPATTANLGPGFDVLGMALNLYNYLLVEEHDDDGPPVEIRVVGEGAGVLPGDETSLVYQAMSRVFEQQDYTPQRLVIWTHNQIPVARGLGSSAAAIVGGLLAASALASEDGPGLDTPELLSLASGLEGHCDNVYPALLGGMVVTAPSSDGGMPPYLKLPVPFTLRILAVVPAYQVMTSQARMVVPPVIPRGDAVFNLGRVGLLVAGFFTNNHTLLSQALEDRLHQPFRQELVPGMGEAMAAARRAGARGVFISGSGPTVMALVSDEHSRSAVGQAMSEAFAREGIAVRLLDLKPDVFGARVVGPGAATSRARYSLKGFPGLPRPRLVVQKYGGTSVATPERMRAVAERIVHRRQQGEDVVVVVSAMGHVTDELLALAGAVTGQAPERELDMLLSTGEQVSIALLAMAVHDLGCPAVSLTGGQAAIFTDPVHTRAKILGVDPQRVLEHLDRGEVVVIAGFQGLNASGDITTLGRGGSDTTAVAVASALGADTCEIYTDVDGVYTADPRLVPGARKLPEISYDEMSEMAGLGARVMQLRAVEFARRFGVPVEVRSSFTHQEGTMIRGAGELVEKVLIRGVTHSVDEVKLVLEGVPDVPGVAAQVFRALADQNIRVDMIIQSMRRNGVNDIAFTVSREDRDVAMRVTGAVAAKLGATVVCEEDIAKVSVVGAGIAQDASVAADMFEALAQQGINIDMISTSGIRVSCVIARNRVEDAVRALYLRFQDRMG